MSYRLNLNLRQMAEVHSAMITTLEDVDYPPVTKEEVVGLQAAVDVARKIEKQLVITGWTSESYIEGLQRMGWAIDRVPTDKGNRETHHTSD